jgi:hypothetical protein
VNSISSAVIIGVLPRCLGFVVWRGSLGLGTTWTVVLFFVYTPSIYRVDLWNKWKFTSPKFVSVCCPLKPLSRVCLKSLLVL